MEVFHRLSNSVFSEYQMELIHGRLNYKEKDFECILKVNQDLIKRFPDDFLLHDRMARNYLAGGYQNKARFHFVESLKLQRKKKLNEGETGLIFMAGFSIFIL